MPICITGMHRSGTSLITRMLNLSGLYLGRQSDMMAASVDNPDGYWENIKFVNINEGVLRCLGGDWDCPPEVPPDWQTQVDRVRLTRRAEVLLGEFAGREPWGWKDPRSSLTSFFWRNLLPDHKVIISLRHPLEVAMSIYRRDHHTPAFGLTLWREYNERLLASIPKQDRLITHFDAYFERNEAELLRVLSFVGIDPTADVLQQCASVARPELRHSRCFMQQLAEPGIPSHVLDLYVAMCEEADWSGGADVGTVLEPMAFQSEIPQAVSALSDEEAAVLDAVPSVDGFEAAAAAAAQQTEQLRGLQLAVAALSEQLEALRQEHQQLAEGVSQSLAERDRALRELHVRLAAMQGQF